MTDEIKERINQYLGNNTPRCYQSQKYIGIAPRNWEVGKLSDVLHNKQRSVPKPEKSYWRLGLRSHAKGTFHEFVGDPEKNDMDELFVVRENDLIVNITFAWEHAIALADKNDNGLLVSHRFPTYVFDDENSPYYFKYVAIQKRFKEMLANISPGGAGRNRVMDRKDFLNLPCYIPPIMEQQKIAQILTQCDKVITLKKERIEEEKKQKKWLMQKLLDPGSGVRLPGFRGMWKKKRIGELFSVGATFSASREQLSKEGLLYLHYGDIHANTSSTINTVKDYELIPKLNNNQVNENTYLTDGDVVFVDASEDYEGSCKFVVIENPSNAPYISGLHTIPLKSKTNELSIEFRKHIFHSYAVKLQIWYYVSGMKILGINKQNILRVAIQLPSVEEQTAIANILSLQDRKINLLEHELEQWQHKKKSLMQACP